MANECRLTELEIFQNKPNPFYDIAEFYASSTKIPILLKSCFDLKKLNRITPWFK